MASTGILNEPFIRVRVVRFSDGTRFYLLENVKLRIDVSDPHQMNPNRPKFPSYDKKTDCIYFETRSVKDRTINIGAFLEMTKICYDYKTTIEDLIRDADETVREYRCSGKGRLFMSIELIIPKNPRKSKKIKSETITKHFGHEFFKKYFTGSPVFCSVCQSLIWGLGSPGYRCQLCSLLVHEKCLHETSSCKQISIGNATASTMNSHRFRREPLFSSTICDHDGKMIPPLCGWKCEECEMLVHQKCKSKVAQSCTVQKMTAAFYDDWKKQNPIDPIETYIVDQNQTNEIDTDKASIFFLDVDRKLKNELERPQAQQYLKLLHNSYERLYETESNQMNSYYNQSGILFNSIQFQATVGRGGSASVYWVKYSARDFALKAIRKHRIIETNEFDCVKNERDILIDCRKNSFIIELFAVFHDFQRVFFLLEYAPCGAFYNFLMRFGSKFDDDCIKWFSGQLVCALDFLHSHLIIHRDLKPENVLLMRDGRLKLSDFGFCKRMKNNEDLTRTFCGTLEYIAPEIFKNERYTFPVDVWSFGIMIYEMATLKTPFFHSSEDEIKARVLRNDFQCSERMNNDLKQLIRSLLKTEPKERLKMSQIRKHRYYSSPYSIDEIEQLKVTSPWKQSIPIDPGHETHLSSKNIALSRIDDHALCTTYTVNQKQFRQFSFIAF